MKTTQITDALSTPCTPATRLDAFLSIWTTRCPSSKLPSLPELAAIVGATEAEVEALLAADTLEQG